MIADFKLNAQSTDSQGIPLWDFALASDGLQMITGGRGSFQRATTSAFFVKGTFKYLPNTGIDWLRMVSPSSELERLDVDDITQEILETFVEQDVPQYFPLFAFEEKEGRRVLRVSVTDGNNANVE